MLRWYIIAAVIFIIDQVSKWLVLKYLVLHQVLAVFPGFNLTLAFNHGAAFGFLANSAGWQRLFFIVLAIVVVGIIVLWLKKLTKADFLEALALTCILGGALGNLLDRVRFGVVIDFIDVYYKEWHWYTFNIADIAICVGSFFLVLTFFKQHKHLPS